MMRRPILQHLGRWSVALSICLVLAACKEDVYSGLDEREVNEMVAVLAAQGIGAGRSKDKDGGYALQVEEADVPASITILREAGYPRETFQTLGDVFSSEGVFGTPFEQHARFIHAMNQELSGTITAIDGVRRAKVLVTAPPRGRFDREAPRATASVAIHYEKGRDIRGDLSSIKMLVAHALPNLDYDDVAVALFEVGGPVVQPAPVPDLKAGPEIEPAKAMIMAPLEDLLSHIPENREQLVMWLVPGLFVLLLFWVFGRRRSA